MRRIATRSGARSIRNVEIDIILTYLLQLFYERGLLEHLAFKGGTMLRKMVFGPRGRLSTDLDFTLYSQVAAKIYRPNSRSISQPSNPAAASGRADDAGGAEVRVGGGR